MVGSGTFMGGIEMFNIFSGNPEDWFSPEEPSYSRWEEIKDLLLFLCECLPGLLMFTVPGAVVGLIVANVAALPWGFCLPAGVVCNVLILFGISWMEERAVRKYQKCRTPR